MIAPTIGTRLAGASQGKWPVKRVEEIASSSRESLRDVSVLPARDRLTNGECNKLEANDDHNEAAITDLKIEALVRQAFYASPYRQFLSLKVYCHSGRVTLQGGLPTYYLKQVVQTIVRTVAGVRDIDNDVKVG